MSVIGYLVSQYPAVSHTFIRREIEAVRGNGVAIRTYSIRPGHSSAACQPATTHAPATFTVLRQPAIAFAAAHLGALAKNPIRYFSTLHLALRHRVPGLRAFLWSIFHFAEAIVLARQLRRDGVTRLHNHFANPAATVGLLATRYLGLPWSLTLHGISEFDYPAGLLLPAKLERAEFAACVSYFGMAQAMRLTRPDLWPRLTLVRCGIDPADLPAAPASARTSDRIELICVGRLSPEKGHAGLLVAVAALVGKGIPVRLTLVGHGPEEAALKARVHALEIDAHVDFAGVCDEAATLQAIAGSDILVLASFMEGLPIVLIEAMGLGVPVIASRVAGIPELVSDGETGLLFDPANWAQLAHVLERLCKDDSLRRELAVSAKLRVREEFCYPDAAKPLIERFREAPLA